MSVRYRSVGEGAPLIFLHNGGASHRIWERQVARLSSRWRCIAFDLPGFAGSADASVRYTLDFYEDFLAAFVEEHQLGPVTLVGNCMGSAIALRYAIANPAGVERLVLCNVLTPKTIRDGAYGGIFKLTEPLAGVRPWLRSMAGALRVPPRFRKRIVDSQLADGDPDMKMELSGLYGQAEQLAALADVLVDIGDYAALDAFTIPKRFPRTLLIWGEDNRVLPVACGRALADTLEPHRFETVPGGHLVMHENAEQVNRLIEEFIAPRRDSSVTEARP